ncbi:MULTISPECIES: phage tail tape measure protein [unclassified Enterobacter cloacae complex]|uniref:phage tail tape measure protein n=1 Tax=unclassified Enterobacter cloacae complex TaxID=2757714 RepID=UPI000B5141A4|nr:MULTISPECIES: phage tail tape measure protein [unclassified Enterobacter cloacae complex]ASD58621.1 phage tail tape measure protein [Enterobacter cloacae complex sp. ECNIH7]POV37502.1 phage tail tape measure protein [Enterobacter cloacae complex sp. ECNIH16]POV43905.1 phage tail tape measure protein [Enterobacter cloacae complex sp. ECNIH11]HDT5660622.1 phage tail tape measure protein [Enterobacter asburiae]
MATLRELIIKISANSSSFQTEISRASRMGTDYYRTMEQGGKKAAAATRETQRSLADLNSQLATVRSSAAGLAGAWAGAFATHQLIAFSDTWNQLNGRLRLASSSSDDYVESQRVLMEISQRTGTSLEANSNLYSRIAQSLRDAGYASADVAKVTETVATSLKLSGASTEEASSVITQLSQALGSGVLRGEEFNSIMENGGRLAKLLADGLGTTVGGLRNMANNGELTTDKIVPLLTNVEILRKEFDTLPASISGSAQKVQNAFLAWVGGANDAVGASSALSGVLDGLANNIDDVANTAGILVGVGLARYFGNMVGSVGESTRAVLANTAAEVALAQAQVRGAQVSVAAGRQAVYRAQQARAAATSIEAQIVAERNLAAAQASLNTALAGRASAVNNLTNTASVMSRLGSGVLGILGGWPGVIIGAGAAMYGLYQHTQQVHKEAVGFANNLDEINGKLQQMSVLGLRSTAADARTSLQAQKQDLADLDSQIAKVKESQAGLALIQEKYNKSPRLTYLNTFMDQADITEKNISLTDRLSQLEFEREKVAARIAATQKLVNEASDLATQRAIQQAGAISILNGAYRLLNQTMAVIPTVEPKFVSPIVPVSNATPQQQTALDRARRDNEMASLNGLEKLHQQHVYEAEDLKLTGALYTQYIYNKDQAAKKDAAAAEAKKTSTAASNAQSKAEREAASTAEQYSRKMADLSVAIDVQRVRATEGEKASDLYAASHQAGTKWTDEQRRAIQASSTELAKWTQKADENVRKQREQADALKDLTEAARKFRDEATLTTETRGMSDRQRSRFDETQQIDRVFAKTDGGTEAIAQRAAALDALDKKYKAIAASEADWTAGAEKGFKNWFDTASDYSSQTADLVNNSMTGLIGNISDALSGNKVDWEDWSKSVLASMQKIILNAMLVNSLKSAGGGGLFGSLGGLFGGGDATSAGSTPSGVYSGAASGLKFAKGGVFDSQNLSHFSNSIISSPTMFKFAKGDGLMGEAGPEAVMPLTRTPNGTLGVRMVGTTASGGGGGEIHITQHINISGNGDAALNRAMQEAARQGAADGAKKARQDMLSDFQTNGQARRMLGV